MQLEIRISTVTPETLHSPEPTCLHPQQQYNSPQRTAVEKAAASKRKHAHRSLRRYHPPFITGRCRRLPRCCRCGGQRGWRCCTWRRAMMLAHQTLSCRGEQCPRVVVGYHVHCVMPTLGGLTVGNSLTRSISHTVMPLCLLLLLKNTQIN